MSYIKAADVLPDELIGLIQNYVDGEYIYIPRSDANKKQWGQNTDRKRETRERNSEIYRRYTEGMSVNSLSLAYYLSPKSIQRIIAVCRRDNA